MVDLVCCGHATLHDLLVLWWLIEDFSRQVFQVVRGLEVSFFRSSLCQRGKIDSLWLISVLFHRLKGKCCWVCRIS